MIWSTILEKLGVKGIAAIIGCIIVVSIGLYVKHIFNENTDLKISVSNLSNANEKMAKDIKDQNESLRAGEIKFKEVQKQLDIANGKNQVLTEQFNQFRQSLSLKPLPKTSDESIVELKSTINDLNKKWNSK